MTYVEWLYWVPHGLFLYKIDIKFCFVFITKYINTKRNSLSCFWSYLFYLWNLPPQQSLGKFTFVTLKKGLWNSPVVTFRRGSLWPETCPHKKNRFKPRGRNDHLGESNSLLRGSSVEASAFAFCLSASALSSLRERFPSSSWPYVNPVWSPYFHSVRDHFWEVLRWLSSNRWVFLNTFTYRLFRLYVVSFVVGKVHLHIFNIDHKIF